MLVSLRVSNLAIIERIEVDFHEGFNVLTGETGAGKSILIGALSLLLGTRASADLIRTGEKDASVEALFEMAPDMRLPLDIETEPVEREVLISRTISRTGRSKCAINGRSATQSMLGRLGHALVSIFGQHEQRALLDKDEHLDMLDTFAGLNERRGGLAKTFQLWKDAKREAAAARRRLEESLARAEENKAACEELTVAALKPSEDEDLAQEREVLKRAVHIREKAFEAHQLLYSKSGSLIGGLTEVKKLLEWLANANPKLDGLRSEFEEALYRIEDSALELRDVAENFRADPQRLEAMEDRLTLIKKLKNKYKRDIPGLLDYCEELRAQEDGFFFSEKGLKALESKEAEFAAAYVREAHALSQERKREAKSFEAAMKTELRELAMPEASLTVEFTALDAERGRTSGLDQVEFLLASNAGEEPRPLAKIASGGELSRIMLAIKALLVDDNPGVTVIFDEVDAGIGGHTASAVGSRLARVALKQQVLCITHLHQVAALADHHVAVRKSVKKGRTRLEAVELTFDDRIDELTRMLGAGPDAKAAKDHVRDLMNGGNSPAGV